MRKKFGAIGLALALAAGTFFGNGYGGFTKFTQPVIVQAAEGNLSDDQQWRISYDGSVYDYVGTDTDVVIPDTITLNGVDVPITVIEFSFLRDNQTVETVTIGENITRIAESAEFANRCPNLKEINVSAENTVYKSIDGVLYSCRRDNFLPAQLLRVPAKSSLKTLTLPESVHTINKTAFNNNNTIEVINLSKNLKSKLYGSTFNSITTLQSVNVDSENQWYSSENGILYNKDKTELLVYPAGKIGNSFTFPENIASIDAGIFTNNPNIETINISAAYSDDITGTTFAGMSGLKHIQVSEENEKYASENGVLYNKDKTILIAYPCCKTDVSIDLPASLSRIGVDAFKSGADALKNITFNSCVGDRTNEEDCFSTLNLTSINHISSYQEFKHVSGNVREYIKNNLFILSHQPAIVNICNEMIDEKIQTFEGRNLTIYEKIKEMHDWACSITKYHPKGEASCSSDNCVPSIFLAGYTTCDGYALGFSLILDRLGVENKYVCSEIKYFKNEKGEDDASCHAFNICKLNGIWLAIDICGDDDEEKGPQDYFFLKTSDEIQNIMNPSNDPANIDYFHLPRYVLPSSHFKYNNYNITNIPDDTIIPDYNPLMGDMDGDGEYTSTDVRDVAMAMRYYQISKAENNTFYDARADVNHDGAIDQTDLDYVMARVQ